jgi:hypothetical protein
MFDIRTGSIRATEDAASCGDVEAQAARASVAKTAYNLMLRLPMLPAQLRAPVSVASRSAPQALYLFTRRDAKGPRSPQRE